jgi:hypothetical protein
MNPTRLSVAVREKAGSGSRPDAGRRRVLLIALDAAVPTVVANAEVLVVAPALNSWLRHWTSDEDAARSRAYERAAGWVEHLGRSGVHAEGRVGDADPLRAIADALVSFPADEIVIAARAVSLAGPLGGLVSRARRRFALPVFCAPEGLERAA